MDKELTPLTNILAMIEKRIAAGDQIPDFGTLAAWAAAEAEKTGGTAARKSGRRQEAEINIKMDGELFS